jgi:hypothetical protein
MRFPDSSLHSLRCEGEIAEVRSRGGMQSTGQKIFGGTKTGCRNDRRVQALNITCRVDQKRGLMQHGDFRLFSTVPWHGSVTNERLRSESINKGRPSDIVVLVKNEEVIPCTTDSERYLHLHRGRSAGPNRSETGGAVHAWLRVQREGIYGLEMATTALSRELLSTLLGDKVDSAKSQASLGVLSYACDPACLRGLVEDNVRVGMRHLDSVLGVDGAAELLGGDSEQGPAALQALLLVCWGAAPVQAGGRSAERKYVDLHVHLSPVPAHVWNSDEVRPPLAAQSRKQRSRRCRYLDRSSRLYQDLVLIGVTLEIRLKAVMRLDRRSGQLLFPSPLSI